MVPINLKTKNQIQWHIFELEGGTDNENGKHGQAKLIRQIIISYIP